MQLQWLSRFLTVWGPVFNSDDKNSYSQLEVSQWYNYQSYEIVQRWLRMGGGGEAPHQLQLVAYFLEGAVRNYFLQAHRKLVRDVKCWEMQLIQLDYYFSNSVLRLADCSWLVGKAFGSSVLTKGSAMSRAVGAGMFNLQGYVLLLWAPQQLLCWEA